VEVKRGVADRASRFYWAFINFLFTSFPLRTRLAHVPSGWLWASRSTCLRSSQVSLTPIIVPRLNVFISSLC